MESTPTDQHEILFTKIERMVDKYPEKPAIIFLDEKYSYRRMKELIDRFATALCNLGVRDGDRVMLYLPNCPQWLIGYFAIQNVGAIPVPISPIYTPREIKYIINDSGAETVICQDTNFGYIKQTAAETCMKRVIVTNLTDLLPSWKRLIGRLFDKVPTGAIVRTKEVHFFKELLRKYPPDPPKVIINSREHIASIQYTSGTTGMPKGVPSTYTALLSSLDDFNALIEGHVGEGGKDVLIQVAPLFHTMAQCMVIPPALARGNPVVLMPVPQVDSILDAIQRFKVTLFLGVPALYRMIIENDRFDSYDLSSLRYCWCGGDVLPLGLFNRWKNLVKIPIHQIYGSTESWVIALTPLDKEPAPGSVGLPASSRQIRIVDPDTLETRPPNTVGELLVTWKHGAFYYWNKPEETAESFVEMDGASWYRTKDYLRMDENRLLYYMDRGADVIKHKGYRVSCSEIEAVLQDHHAVIGACVVGVPDEKVGERIKAMVVLKEDTKGVSAVDLIKWCRDRLASYKIPQYIEFRDMLPKSKVGKLLRREVRDEERRRIGK